MLNIELNQTIEDYLRSLYRIQQREGEVPNVTLARDLGITSSAVTEMARKLGKAGLVRYRRYEGLTLTDQGMRMALGITRRHRLWEVFLIDHLGFSWDQVHEIADHLEHIDSAQLVDRLERFLGYPTHDPHGDPIPTRDGKLVDEQLIPLVDMGPGDLGKVRRVSDEVPELLRYASSLGLAIGADVKVLERIAFDSSLRISTSGQESVVSEKLANRVFIERGAGRAKRRRS